MNKKEYEELANVFENISGINLCKFIDKLLLIMTNGDWALDVIKFDDFLITKYKYDIEKHGSTFDFIENKWGKESVDIIKQLI